MKETLRLQPTAPAWTVTPIKDTTLDHGKYAVKQGQPICIVLHALHRDPAVWGPDAEAFKPERMLREESGDRPTGCWKAFGNGSRACLGRRFAWQETMSAVAMVRQVVNLTRVLNLIALISVADLPALRFAQSR